MSFVSNLMNRLKWTKKLPESEVVILHRGAPGNMTRLRGDHITEIKKGHFCYTDKERGKEIHIPMHRVLEIWMDEKLVWKKRTRKDSKNTGKRKIGKKPNNLKRKRTGKKVKRMKRVKPHWET